MQHGVTLDNFSFGGLFYIHTKSPREQLPWNNHKHGARKNYFNKNKIYAKSQSFLRLQLLSLVQKRTQFALMNPMTILTIWIIPMNILTLLTHKNNTLKTMRLNRTDSMKR